MRKNLPISALLTEEYLTLCHSSDPRARDRFLYGETGVEPVPVGITGGWSVTCHAHSGCVPEDHANYVVLDWAIEHASLDGKHSPKRTGKRMT